MAESVQIATLEGGELKVPSSGGRLREIALGLPLSRLLVKMVSIPADQVEQAEAYVLPQLERMSPYPDDPLHVSCETLRETESGRIVLAAALPESSAEDIGSILDEAKLNVTRVDAIPLGLLPGLMPQITAGSAGDAPRRRMLLLASPDCLSVFVFDGDLLCAIRAVSPGADLRRELMLSLIEAESFAGPATLAEVLTVGEMPEGDLSFFAPVRALSCSGDPLPGLTARALDPLTINALPDSWAAVLDDERFKRKATIGIGIAGVLWLLVMAVIIGMPRYYAGKTQDLRDHQKSQRARYNAVKDMKDQVSAVQAISNHNTGCLETLRAVVSALPEAEEFVLSKWFFKRNEFLSFNGTAEAGSEKAIGRFKDRLSALRLSQITGDEADAETPFFARVTFEGSLTGGRFALKCHFENDPEEVD